MSNRRRGVWSAAVCFALGAGVSGLSAQQKPNEKEADSRPRITVRAQPPVAVTPARIVLTAELIGGADDFEEYYCPTVVWEWGDDTSSESTIDCEPYEAGRTQIRRRFTVEHVFRRSGTYKVLFRLKRRDRLVATATTNVQVQPGARDF